MNLMPFYQNILIWLSGFIFSKCVVYFKGATKIDNEKDIQIEDYI